MAPNRRNILILFVTLVIVMMSFGMVIPILPFYIEAFGATESNQGLLMTLLMAIFAAMQFLFAPIWGQLSDRYGRRGILMLGILGNAISMLLFGLSSSLWMLYISRALGGILSSATLPTAMAYMGDSTSEEERSGGMGLMGAAMGVGMVLGPGLGGALAKGSLATPFFVGAALSAVLLPFVFVILPESLPKEQRTRQAKSQGNVWATVSGLFRGMWQALSSPIGFLLVLAFLLSFGLTNFEGVFGLYAKDLFGYDAGQVGLILVVIGLVSAVAQGALTGPFTKRWGEVAVVRASLIGSAVGFVLMLLAKTDATLLLTVGFFVLSNAMLRPAVTSLTSKRAAGGQGAAMGLINSFMSLGRIVGPLWAGVLYDIDTGFPYLSGALVMVAGFGMALLWLKVVRIQAVEQQSIAEEAML